MRDEFDRLGRANLTYVEYPGLDHHSNDADGISHLPEVQQHAYDWMSDTGLLPK